MTTLDILYKRTTTGAVQIWRQEFNDAGDGYRTISGQQDGKLVTSEWTICTGKNIGRANETTPQQQAASEVESNYTKKLNQGGYARDLKDIDKENFFKPMLAKNYEDYPVADFSKEAWYSQPKLDGIRCVGRRDGLWTRQGKPIPTCPHILEALEPLFQRFGDDAPFDGEIYTDKLADDFNELVSLAKKGKPTAVDHMRSRATLQYHMYDLPAVEGTFEERIAILQEAIASLGDQNVLVFVKTDRIQSQEHLDELYAGYIEAGQEGQMVRRGASAYQNKRTKDLLKRKEFLDNEFEVVSVHEGVGNRSGMAGYVTLKLEDGRTFKATPMGTNAQRQDMLARADELVGKMGTVKYFKPTPDGIPRFPVLKAIHTTARW